MDEELLHFGASHATDGESNGPKGKRCCDHIISFAMCGFLCSAIHVTYLALFGILIIDISSEFSLVGWEKNLILGSFSCGYAIGQIPCGLFVMKFGGYYGPMFANFISGIIFIFLPSVVKTFAANGHTTSAAWTFAVALFSTGLINALYNPSFHVLIANKVPHKRHNMVHNMIYSGQQFGGVIATVVMDSFIAAFGWKVAIEVVGGTAIGLGLLWYVIMDKDTFAKNSVQAEGIATQLLTSPEGAEGRTFSMKYWKPVLLSASFWVMCLNHFGSTYAWYFVINYMPTYLKVVHKVEFKELGFISCLPRLLSFLIIMLSGKLAAYVVRKNLVSITNLRKLFQAAGLIPSSILFMLLCHIQSTEATIGLVVLASGLGGFAYLGFHINSIDLAPLPNMAGLMFCISNTIGTSSGVAVAFTNNLVFSQGSYLTTGSKWIMAWNIAAYIQIACAILFLFFASGERIGDRRLATPQD